MNHCRYSRPLPRTRVGVVTRLLVVMAVAVSTITALVAASVVHSPAASATGNVPCYVMVASDGGIFNFGGGNTFFGSEGGQPLNKPIVGMATTPDSEGYWLVASDGGIFTFGDAGFYGSEGNQHLNQPIVGMAATPDGKGYWLAASDGGIFTFGDAGFYGSKGGEPLNKPIVGMAATPDGQGYWLVASDGGIFTFGDAGFYGSKGGEPLNKPIVGMAATPDGQGYWLVASDGGIFTFGDAPYLGSEGGKPLNKPIVGMAATPDGQGYWLVASDGGVFTFGDAGFYASEGGVTLNKPVVGIAMILGAGQFTPPPKPAVGLGFPSGSYGYDVSNYNCGNLPAAMSIGVVQVVGASFGYTNDCLATEAQWAGNGLNLYMFLTWGAASGSLLNGCPPSAGGQPNYCYGYAAAQAAFAQAKAAGVNTNVPWWLDIEPTQGTGLPLWSSDTNSNDLVIQGAHDGLIAEGLANVGVYASPGDWPSIAGSGSTAWQPSYPYWMATWTSSGPDSCGTVAGWQASEPLPTGAVAFVQWTDDATQVNGNPVDGDYAC